MAEGYTVKEIVTEVRDDLKAHIKDSDQYMQEIAGEFAKRPTRAGIYRFVTVFVLVLGTGVGVAVAFT